MPAWDVTFNLRLDASRPDLVGALAEANALSRVNAALPIPPDTRMHFNRLYIHRAVAGTTDIEGAEVTEEEVSRILQADPSERVLPAARAREEREVRNAAAVMEYIAETLDRDPDLALSEAMIRHIHELTTAGVEYKHNTPGRYRNHAVTAGTFTPPRSGDEVRRLMQEFIQWLHGARARALPPIARAIAAHFYFVSIHPFGDGNGRTARAIESLLLYQARVNALGFYSLANFYYQHRDAYIDGLDDVRFRSGGDLTPFVLFATAGLVGELEQVTSDVLGSLTQIAYRDFVHKELERTGKAGTKAGTRMYGLVSGLSAPVPLRAIRDGSHVLARLYWRLHPKTLARDVEFLRQLRLVVVEDRQVRANVDLMLASPGAARVALRPDVQLPRFR